MNATYFRKQGFDLLPENAPQGANLFTAARYRHSCAAQDGTLLYAEQPLGIQRYRLSALVAPLDQAKVFADISLADEAGFELAVAAFFAAHGGVGQPAASLATTNFFRPYRRKD